MVKYIVDMPDSRKFWLSLEYSIEQCNLVNLDICYSAQHPALSSLYYDIADWLSGWAPVENLLLELVRPSLSLFQVYLSPMQSIYQTNLIHTNTLQYYTT